MLIEHSTDDSGLEAKWLYDQSTYKGKKLQPGKPEGDLIKAIKEAERIRENIPDAEFTVYLTTNQNVNTDLWTKVITVADAGKVSIELIELKTIANFLDTTVEGQYLRKMFLGIDQELLSKELFLEIEKAGLKQYATDFFIEPNTLLEEWNINELETHVENSSNHLTFIVADSGLGKTTLCYNFINKTLNEGGHCLRIAPDVIENANDLYEAIAATITRSKPKLFLNSESRKLITALNPVIVIDDINKEDRIIAFLDKLVSWSFANSNTGKEEVSAHSFHIICPIWSRHLARVSDSAKKSGSYNVMTFAKPDEETAKQIARNWLNHNRVHISDIELNELIFRTDKDPLLLNLALQHLKHGVPQIAVAGRRVIREFVLGRINSLSTLCFWPDIKKTRLIGNFGFEMLREKNLSPNYNQLLKWHEKSPDLLTMIDSIAVSGEIFHFDASGEIHFRHDRIRDFILVEGLVSALEDMRGKSDTVFDPYYSRHLAAAITEKDLNNEELDIAIRMAPLAVFNSLRYVETLEHALKREQILSCIKKWKGSLEFKDVHPKILYAITRDLTDIDSKDMKTVVNNLPQNHNTFIALLRNGNAIGGINYLASQIQFEPYVTNWYRDIIIQHASAYHQDNLVVQLSAVLTSRGLTEVGLKGTLLFSGYLRDPRLVSPIISNWKTHDDPELLGYYLWATIKCFDDSTWSEVSGLFDSFMELPDEGYEESGFAKGVRNSLLYIFSKVQWKLTSQQIGILGQALVKYEPLITSIYENIDHPVALKVIVDKIAERIERAGPNSFYANFHPSDKWSFERTKYRLSDASINFLLQYWKNCNNTRTQREVSFRFWANNTSDSEIVPILRTVNEDDVLFEKSVLKRVELRDHTALKQLQSILSKKPFLIHAVHYVWSEEAIAVYRQVFNSQRSNFHNTDHLESLVEILRKIPVEDAELLLVEYWDDIKNATFGVSTALYIGTEKTVSLAAAEILTTTEPEKYFAFIDQCYGCYLQGMESRITEHKLEMLTPYLSFINKQSLRTFAEQCRRSGFHNWLKNTLSNYLNDDDKVDYFPTASDLSRQLKSAIANKNAHYWVDQLNRRSINKKLIIESLEIFSKQIENYKEFATLANILSDVGSRKDLAILKSVSNANISETKKGFIIEGATFDIYSRTLD